MLQSNVKHKIVIGWEAGKSLTLFCNPCSLTMLTMRMKCSQIVWAGRLFILTEIAAAVAESSGRESLLWNMFAPHPTPFLRQTQSLAKRKYQMIGQLCEEMVKESWLNLVWILTHCWGERCYPIALHWLRMIRVVMSIGMNASADETPTCISCRPVLDNQIMEQQIYISTLPKH